MHTETKTAREVLAESDWAAENTASSKMSIPSYVSAGMQPMSPTSKPSSATPTLPARPSPAPAPSLPTRPAAPLKTSSAPPAIPPKPSAALSADRPSAYVNSRTGYVPKKLNVQVNSDLCAKCDKPVYAAELVLGASKKYHKMCFRCFNCNKQLDSTNMVDKNFEVYCRPCYSKEFGPKVTTKELVDSCLLTRIWFKDPVLCSAFHLGIWIWRAAIYRRCYSIKSNSQRENKCVWSLRYVDISLKK